MNWRNVNMKGGEEGVAVDKTGPVYCVICSTEMHNVTWEAHVKTSSHMAALEKFELVFKTEEKALEDHKISSHRVIPWDSIDDVYDKYEIFVKNQILECKSLFHCCLCEVTYAEWSTALVHVTDFKHQSLREKIARELDGMLKIAENNLSHELLVKEGLLAQSASRFECKFCKSQSVSIENVCRHVKGLAHICNRSKFVLKANFEIQTLKTESEKSEKHRANETSKKETKKFTRVYDFNVDRNFENISTKIQANIPCDYTVQKDGCNIDCFVCDCTFHAAEKARHIASNDHTNALKRYGCDNISAESTKEYYCNICDCTISCVWNVYEHIREQSHSTALNSLRESSQGAIDEPIRVEHIDVRRQDTKDTWIVPINDKFSRCLVCNYSISNLSLQMGIHVKGRFHENSLKMYGCDKITIQKADTYYCTCCNCEINNTGDVQLHVKSVDHLKSLKQSKQRVTEASKSTSKECATDEKRLNSSGLASTKKLSAKKANTIANLLGKLNLRKPDTRSLQKTNSNTITENRSRIDHIERLKKHFIVQLSDMSLRCLLCECRVFPLFGKLNEHIDGTHHKEAIMKYSCDQISFNKDDDTYRCKLCNVDIVELEDVCHHAKEKHGENGLLTSNNWLNNNEELPQNSAGEKIDYYVTLSKDTMSSYCHICECVLSPSISNINLHVSGKVHVKSLLKYGCDNVTFEKNLGYHCKYCNSDIGDLGKVYCHIKTSSHLNFVSAVRSQTLEPNEIPVKFKSIDEIDTSDGTKIRSLAEAATVSPQTRLDDIKNHNERLTQSPTSTEKHDFDEIIILNENKYFCKCCNCTICGYEGVGLHSRGKKHISARSMHLRNLAFGIGETV